MRKTARSFICILLMTMMASCVTINVYFPAAAVQKAADEFISDVLSSESLRPEGAFRAEPQAPVGGYSPGLIAMSAWALIPSASAAEADIDITSPQVEAIKQQMEQRQRSSLKPLFDSGAIGFTNDGLVTVRDRTAVGLKDRSGLDALIAAENRDRLAVYREIAVANGHPEWEKDIRDTFARRWIGNASVGWYYQDANGEWSQKR